jgi:hypothetical protein
MKPQGATAHERKLPACAETLRITRERTDGTVIGSGIAVKDTEVACSVVSGKEAAKRESHTSRIAVERELIAHEAILKKRSPGQGCDAASERLFRASGRFLNIRREGSLFGLVPARLGAARSYALGTESAPATLRPSGAPFFLKTKDFCSY